jgi:ribonuclease Z
VKIIFLGTGSGKTSLKRHHSSLLISSSNHNLLVDCGDGVSSAILKQNISFSSINSILISHLHADHYSGLASLITQMVLLQRKETLAIYIHKSLIDYLENFLLHSYLFRERMDFELKIIPFEEEKEIKIAESFYFTSKLNSHLEKYRKNNIANKLTFASLSFLIKDQNSSVIYSGDIGSVQDLFLFNDKVDWFITEVSHVDLKDITVILSKNNPDQIILTHIDDETEEPLQKFLNSLPNDQKSHFFIAFDGFILHHNS